MLEGVLVAFVLVTLFTALIGISGLYKSKLLVIQDARFRNMLNATNNCEPFGRAYAAQRPPVPDDMPSIPEEVKQYGLDFARTVQDGGGVSRATTSRKFGYGDAGFFLSGQVSSHAYTLCNEKPQGFNLAKVIGDVFAKSWDLFANDVIAPALGNASFP